MVNTIKAVEADTNMSLEIEKADWGLAPLHGVLLETLTYVDKFCSENEIEYCLAYGTVLGAIRHHGFIPWDDDADIYMTLKNYIKFKKCFVENGDERFYLQEMKAVSGMVTMSKLRVNGTTCIEPTDIDKDMHQGIYIDIFILFPAPKSVYKKHIMNLANQYLVIKDLSNNHYSRRKAYLPILAFLRLFPKNFLRRAALLALYDEKGKSSEELYDVDLRKYKSSFWKSNQIFPTRKVEFEGKEFCVPGHADTYLDNVYGNWHVFPSTECINRSQHAVLIKADEDFRKYCNNIKDFSDERI